MQVVITFKGNDVMTNGQELGNITCLKPFKKLRYKWGGISRLKTKLIMSLAKVILGILYLVTWSGALALGRSSDVTADLRICYAQTAPNDAITCLQKKIDTGRFVLEFDNKWGYLPAVLKALNVPVSSQMLVFSKTSVQKEAISPQTPRALYFNDSVYIGYVPEAKSLEVSAIDPRLGPVYYVLLQKPKEKPLFFRTVDACLECHATKSTHFIPENLMHSIYCDSEGVPFPKSQIYQTSDRSPFIERWGGWYVTGSHGKHRHMGNSFAEQVGIQVKIHREKGTNIIDLHTLLDTSQYPTPNSDIVALMVLAHQTHLQNLMTQANYQIRATMLQRASLHETASFPLNIKKACEPLVEGLLFVGETPIVSKISGVSGFKEHFSYRSLRDRKHRSLRDLDLHHRLFEYPCSYTIYSNAFDGLPNIARDYVFHRLTDILSGRDKSGKFTHLSRKDRKAIQEILLDTKPGFAAFTKMRGS